MLFIVSQLYLKAMQSADYNCADARRGTVTETTENIRKADKTAEFLRSVIRIGLFK